MELVNCFDGKEFEPTDFPWWSSNILIFNLNALESVGALIEPYGEFLPLSCSTLELFLYHPLCAFDVNPRESVIQRFKSSGRIKRIQKISPKDAGVKSTPIFHIKELRASPTYVSQEFVDHYNQLKLRGLVFEEVYSE